MKSNIISMELEINKTQRRIKGPHLEAAPPQKVISLMYLEIHLLMIFLDHPRLFATQLRSRISLIEWLGVTKHAFITLHSKLLVWIVDLLQLQYISKKYIVIREHRRSRK